MELQPTPHLFYAAANGALHTHLRDTVKFSKNTPSHKCTFLEMLLQNHFERSHFVLSTNQNTADTLTPLTAECSAITQRGSL